MAPGAGLLIGVERERRQGAGNGVRGVLVAIATNTFTRCTVAAVAEGSRYALRVALSLTASLAIVAIAAWWHQRLLAG